MAAGRAREAIKTAPTPTGEVIAFRQRAVRSTPPRYSIEERLQRAGFALAAELFVAYEGTDASNEAHVHAATVVAVIATLAAECAQAAAAVNRRAAAAVSPGGWVLGGGADAVLFDATAANGVSTVWGAILAGALAAGLASSDLPDLARVVAHAEATVGEKPYPVLTVASSYRPKALLRAAAARHRHALHAFAADEGLCSPHEQALVAGAAIAEIIRHEPRPAPLTLLAAEVMIGSARLEPLPFAAS